MKKDVVIAILATFCLTSAIFMVLPTRSSPGEYDPWIDNNEDGAIDIFDAIGLANAFATSGDPTKNVNVMNWPVTAQQTVCWARTIGGNTPNYNASGFSQMHLIWHVAGLVDPENVTIFVIGQIDNPEGGFISFPVESFFITSTKDPDCSTCIPVPSELFGFYFSFGSGTTASITLAFYLTYA